MNNKIPKDAYILIIGAMKSGTTSLYNYLIQHPQICGCQTKEPEYFSENQGHGIKIDNYEDLFAFNPVIHKYVLEASTGYSKFPFEPNVVLNIKSHNIHPKFIYMVRNPIDRIISQYIHVKKDNKDLSFNDMYKYLIDYSKYFMQIEQYLRYFKKEDICVIEFDALKNSPDKTMVSVFSFLNLAKTKKPILYDAYNQTTGLSARHRNYLKIIDRKFSYLPEKLKDLLKLIVKLRFGTKKIKLSPSQVNRIKNDLKEDMAQLSKEFGVNIKAWGF